VKLLIAQKQRYAGALNIGAGLASRIQDDSNV